MECRGSGPGIYLNLAPEILTQIRKNGTKMYTVCLYIDNSNKPSPVIAIRREDASIWERRAPLSPSNVLELKKKGVKVLIQPSNRRAYPNQAYVSAGAIVQENISEASVIFGVKQVPVDLLIPDKTYCIFSHTIKGQESNMPLLDAILEKNIRLIDYEKILGKDNKRVVCFGKYAGIAGMLNILHGLGLRLLALGYHNPFLYLGPAHIYQNSNKVKRAVRELGLQIALDMIPERIGPLIFVFVGSGNVSQGAQEIFRNLSHEFVTPDKLQETVKYGTRTKVYGCVVSRSDYLERIDGGSYKQDEFEANPRKYKSTFHETIAPYASVIINGIFWDKNSPRLLTTQDARVLVSSPHKLSASLYHSERIPQPPHRLLAICDISADEHGSIEFTKKHTTISNPFTLYDPLTDRYSDSLEDDGILLCSVDNMPTQLPLEATDLFGNQLMPYIWDIIKSDASKPLLERNFKPSIYNAIVASNGKLTDNFQYIQELRKKNMFSNFKVSGTYRSARLPYWPPRHRSLAPITPWILKNKDKFSET